MRLDAAHASYAARTPLVRSAALAGESGADSGPPELAPAATPPPSLDGKGSLINTYA
jgi:hypothetical protein